MLGSYLGFQITRHHRAKPSSWLWTGKALVDHPYQPLCPLWFYKRSCWRATGHAPVSQSRDSDSGPGSLLLGLRAVTTSPELRGSVVLTPHSLAQC